MGDNDSAQEPTNFPVGNRDEVPSESPEKAVSQTTNAADVVPNDTPEQDVAEAKADREQSGAPTEGAASTASATQAGDAGGDSIESPETDPNRADAKPAVDEAEHKL